MPFEFVNLDKVYKNDPELKKSDVESLQDWATKQPHLPKISELQIILFLQSCYYSNEQAKYAIDNFFTIKTICSDMFGNRNPAESSVKMALETALITVLPNTTPEGYNVSYSKLMDTNPDLYQLIPQVRIFDMILMHYLAKNGPSKGFALILDMEGGQFGHLTKFSPVSMKKFLYYLQEAMPIRLKSIHLINTVSFVDKLIAMTKPFVKKEVFELLHVHSGSIETLFEFVPKELLPNELGGSGGTHKSLHEKIIKEMNESLDLFKFEENQTVDESKRPGKPKDISELFGIEGTFKKLQVD